MTLTVSEKRMLDSAGRERIFNGINLIYKGEKRSYTDCKKQYIRTYQETDFKHLRENGINLVRLGIVWDAIEHEMGNYDDTYFKWISGILDMCHQYGIYVYLDMHQDLYSCQFDGGAPKWATITDGAEHISGDLWSDAYLFSDAVNTAYRNFWKNKKVENGKGLQDHYQDLWLETIRRLGDHEAVIGYDFINEPFPGEHALEIMGRMLTTYGSMTGKGDDPKTLMAAFSNPEQKMEMLHDLNHQALHEAMAEAAKPLVADFDQGHLSAFYNKMTAAVRAHTVDGLITTENCYFSNMGVESSITSIMVNGQKESKQVYSPHGYDLVVDTPAVVMASNNRMEVILNAHKRVQERLNVPVIFGEWGAHLSYQEGLDHIRFIMNYFDRNKWSHTYYCWEPGIETYPVMAVLSRPYPQAVSGEIVSYGYDYEENTFKLTWQEDSTLLKPTVIYMPKSPNHIEITGNYEVKPMGDKGHLLYIDTMSNQERTLVIQF